MRILLTHMLAVVAACKDMLEQCGFDRALWDANSANERANRVLSLANSTCDIIEHMRIPAGYWHDTFMDIRMSLIEYGEAAVNHIAWCASYAQEDWDAMLAEAGRLTDAATDHVQDAHACYNGECFHDVLLSTSHAKALTQAATSLVEAIPIADARIHELHVEIVNVTDDARFLDTSARSNIYADEVLFGDNDVERTWYVQ